MSLSLLAPLGLLALLATIVPLLIHLVRRQDEQVIDFAALRWLRSQLRPRRKRRFDEWLLLLLRLLLLTLLALWLAKPLLQGAASTRPWIVVAPGVPAANIDKLTKKDEHAALHWLAPGFPQIKPDQPAPASPQPIASLLRELDSVLPAATPLTVIVPAIIDGADAERPRLSRKVTWTRVDAAPLAASSNTTVKPMQMALHVAPSHAAAARWFRAADAAWRVDLATDAAPTLHALQANAAPSGAHDVLIWLDTAPLPAAVRTWLANGHVLVLPHDAADRLPPEASVVIWRSDDGAPLLREQRVGTGRFLQFAVPLTPDAFPGVLESTFPRELHARLAPSNKQPTRADAREIEPVSGLSPWPTAPRPLQPWLGVVIAALVLIERLLANRPAREGRT